MEKKLYTRLWLENGSKVLDAGAGSGIVAINMAEHGLRVEGIDLTNSHVAQAKRIVKSRGLEEHVSVRLGDYHDLSSFPSDSLDGVYTMETFVHADVPQQGLQNFKRVLKPGGVLMLHEADFHWDSELLQQVLRLSHCQNTLRKGSYETLLEEAGFAEIDIENLSDNVLPLWRLFGVLGAIPYDILRLFGLQHRFTNVMAGVEVYRHWDQGRYLSLRAVKPRSRTVKRWSHIPQRS